MALSVEVVVKVSLGELTSTNRGHSQLKRLTYFVMTLRGTFWTFEERQLNQATLIGLSILVGATIPLQAAANAKLGEVLAAPLWSAFVALSVSAISILIVLLASRTPLPGSAISQTVPSWAWLGGLAGAVFIATGIYFVPRIGAANFLVATIAGQLILAALLDHQGWLGLQSIDFDIKRAAGLVLVSLGAILFTVDR